MYISPYMSLVAAGVASAICILIVSNVLKRKAGGDSKEEREIPVNENRCSCCLRPFLLGRGGVRCNDCRARSCRKGCSRWDTSENAWHCLFCHQQRLWLKKNRLEDYVGLVEQKDLEKYLDTAKSQLFQTGVENAATSSGSCLAREKEDENTMETIRDFVEKIVQGLIGDSVKDTPIDRLYDHPAYEKLLEKYIVPLVDALTRLLMALELFLKNKASTDSPTMAHTALRDIVERAVDEARKLPSLGSSGETTAGRAPEERNVVAEHSYEELLATAILNKVIEKFQKEQVDGNSNVLHGKPVPANKCTSRENEPGLDEDVEEGCCSLEPLSQDDCSSSDSSASCSRRVKNHQGPTVSLMIEERIEEVTTTYASEEEGTKENHVLPMRNAHRVPFPELGMDIIDPSQESSEDSQDEADTPTTHIGLVSPIESWEENWLFQRKRVQTQADPVAMLVPNPSAEYKALIGDKDAEDTSDLSECSSAQSDEEIEKELMDAISNVAPRSPKRTAFENGLDHQTETTNDTLKEKQTEILAKHANQRKNSFQETDNEWNEEINGQSNCVQNGKMSEHREAKEIERETKLKKHETRSMIIIDDDSTKIPVERPNEGDKIERSVNNSGSKKKIEINNPTDLKDVNQEENFSDVPKTPTSTPTWMLAAETNLEDTLDERIVSREENVLNSLECAKKKLMAVNEDTTETLKEKSEEEEEEEKPTAEQTTDFHAEDIQQESEYTEHYDTAIQMHLDSLTEVEASGQVKRSEENIESKCRKAAALAKAESVSTSQKKKKSEEQVLTAPPRPGTIAEREHKKWENAPPIQNNPYSEENIQKRLWERQYSRKPSDIPGIHTELPKSNGEDLNVVLAPQEPDIKRFGRDYYINHSKVSASEKEARSAASTSSRPNSSLSQGSSSTGAEQDHQEETRYRETQVLLNRSNDVKFKVAKWQNNNNNNTNTENKYRSIVRSADSSNEVEKMNEVTEVNEKNEQMWEDQRMEEILENERKNNKNEINAKLNNQENYDSPVIETKKNSDENPRKIKRIDLKAYGFENEFFSNPSNKTIKTSTPRVVNKLDLKSFGYDGGIRRTKSNIQLNTIGNDDFKPRVVRVTNKSNLTRLNRHYGNDPSDLIENRASGDNNLTQSTEHLNKFHTESYNGFGLKSAKSVPNIAKFYSNNTIDSQQDEQLDSYSQSSYDLGISKSGSGMVRNIANNYNVDKCKIKSSDGSIHESENHTDNSSENEERYKKILNQQDFDKALPMPSVRRLAEAFSKQSEHGPITIAKANKSSNAYKERSSTPEIQIVESPRQMHSLTARSLSKQFRDGLRQIPNKVTSPPASHVAVEQGKLMENQTEMTPAKPSDTSNDVNVILPGKLKLNIIFWEQMQKRS